MSGEKKLDASSEHFNMVAAQRDQEPSTISCTNTISESIKKMDWYVSMKKSPNFIRTKDRHRITYVLAR